VTSFNHLPNGGLPNEDQKDEQSSEHVEDTKETKENLKKEKSSYLCGNLQTNVYHIFLR